MQILTLPGEVLFFLLLLVALIIAVYSRLENEKRSFILSLLIAVGLLCLGLLFELVLVELKRVFFPVVLIVGVVFILWIFISKKPKNILEIRTSPQKIDERDVIFARFDLTPDSRRWSEYYGNKELQEKIDIKIRKEPDILSPEHWKKAPVLFSLAESEFDFLEHQLTEVDGTQTPGAWSDSPAANTRMLKNILFYLGAKFCGVCLVEPAYIYSHVGRGPDEWGKKIENTHKYAVPFAVEMDPRMIAPAPQAPVIVETAKQYVEVARISIIAAQMLRRLGHSARAHIAGSNYQAMLTPLAWLAGLGELGRMGMLITKKYGPRIRLGLLTTDLPLLPDRPQFFGVQDFCQICLKCAKNCPSQAIPEGAKIEENGVIKWVLNREECYRFWRRSGTDCSRCIYVCPYSKPDNLLHKAVRKLTENSIAAQYVSVHADDLFYGRKPVCKRSPTNLKY